MTSPTTQRRYTIKEAAALTGLPASTLRYYESIGVIPPVSRGASSGHRAYGEDDLDQLMWVSCLAATGMSVNDMRTYIANGALGPAAARDQIDLLAAQQQRLAEEAEQRDCVSEAARAGRTILLSSHILGEVERLCSHVTIIREGRTVESGSLATASSP